MTQELIITKSGLEKAKTELAERMQMRSDLIARIDAARQLGDLKENAEYHIAKEEHGMNESKMAELQHLISNAQVVDDAETSAETVAIGTTVVLEQKDGKIREYKIVSFNETNPSAGWISNESPIARSILGRKKGDRVSVTLPNGIAEYLLKEIK